MIRVFDAFSGIGGFRYAFERCEGFKTVGWCEIDRFAQKSYRALSDTGNLVADVIFVKRSIRSVEPAYASAQTDKYHYINENLGDYNSDGKKDAIDASEVLTYYAKAQIENMQ